MFTVINRFTVRGDSDRLEHEFVRAAGFLRRQPDFDFLVRVRPVDRSDVVVQLGYWSSHAAFVNAVRKPGFAAQIKKLSSQMGETQADHAVSVVRVMDPRMCTLQRDAYGILTEYTAVVDQQEFERTFLEHARSYLSRPDFGGIDLLRSTLRPRRYLGLSWWFDPAARAAAAGVGAATGVAGSAILAQAVRIEQTQRISYERATAG